MAKSNHEARRANPVAAETSRIAKPIGRTQTRNGANLGDKSPLLRRVVSIVLAVHLLAIVAEPIRFFTRSSNGRPSAAFEPIRSMLAPYVEIAYLNHGYFFFAPNPGPSHLMDCRLISAGTDQRRLRLPNHKVQWPRLLYHRHFMLAEFLNNLFTIDEPPVDVDPASPIIAQWRRSLTTYRSCLESMQRHLAHKYGSDSATIRRVEHRWPTEYEFFEQKWRIDDERLYWVLPESALSETEKPLPQAAGSPVVQPQNKIELIAPPFQGGTK